MAEAAEAEEAEATAEEGHHAAEVAEEPEDKTTLTEHDHEKDGNHTYAYGFSSNLLGAERLRCTCIQ